jgi:hypothetical protein
MGTKYRVIIFAQFLCDFSLCRAMSASFTYFIEEVPPPAHHAIVVSEAPVFLRYIIFGDGFLQNVFAKAFPGHFPVKNGPVIYLNLAKSLVWQADHDIGAPGKFAAGYRQRQEQAPKGWEIQAYLSQYRRQISHQNSYKPFDGCLCGRVLSQIIWPTVRPRELRCRRSQACGLQVRLWCHSANCPSHHPHPRLRHHPRSWCH